MKQFRSRFSNYRDERYEFIRAKYVEKKFSSHSCADERDLLSDLEHAVNNKNLYHLLEVFAEGVDLSAPLPSSVSSVSCSVGDQATLHNYASAKHVRFTRSQ
jgi:hypothetical protein